MPLYYWQGDAKPGDVTGDGVNGFSVAKAAGGGGRAERPRRAPSGPAVATTTEPGTGRPTAAAAARLGRHVRLLAPAPTRSSPSCSASTRPSRRRWASTPTMRAGRTCPRPGRAEQLAFIDRWLARVPGDGRARRRRRDRSRPADRRARGRPVQRDGPARGRLEPARMGLPDRQRAVHADGPRVRAAGRSAGARSPAGSRGSRRVLDAAKERLVGPAGPTRSGGSRPRLPCASCRVSAS